MSVWDLLEATRRDALGGRRFQVDVAPEGAPEWGRWKLVRPVPPTGHGTHDECFVVTPATTRRVGVAFLRRFPRFRLDHPTPPPTPTLRQTVLEALDTRPRRRGHFRGLSLPPPYLDLFTREGAPPCREAQALERVIDIGQVNDVPYWLTPYVPGVDLFRLCLTPAERVVLFVAASRAVDVVHQAGLAHGGGLTPARIRLSLDRRFPPIYLPWSFPVRADPDGVLRAIETTSLPVIHGDRRRLAVSTLLEPARFRVLSPLLDEPGPSARVLVDQLLERLQPDTLSPVDFRRYLLGMSDCLESAQRVEESAAVDTLRGMWDRAAKVWDKEWPCRDDGCTEAPSTCS